MVRDPMRYGIDTRYLIAVGVCELKTVGKDETVLLLVWEHQANFRDSVYGMMAPWTILQRLFASLGTISHGRS